MRNWKKIVGLLVVLAVWLGLMWRVGPPGGGGKGLMWRLSTADGTETLQDSMRFARKIGSWIYESPTVQQLNHLNLLLRKLAHVFLYAILGGMMALLWQLLLELHRIGWRILGAAACSTTIAFLDELQKIPIAGRHFDFSESLLNAGSALVVILLFFGIAGLLSRKKSTS